MILIFRTEQDLQRTEFDVVQGPEEKILNGTPVWWCSDKR